MTARRSAAEHERPPASARARASPEPNQDLRDNGDSELLQRSVLACIDGVDLFERNFDAHRCSQCRCGACPAVPPGGQSDPRHRAGECSRSRQCSLGPSQCGSRAGQCNSRRSRHHPRPELYRHTRTCRRRWIECAWIGKRLRWLCICASLPSCPGERRGRRSACNRYCVVRSSNILCVCFSSLPSNVAASSGTQYRAVDRVLVRYGSPD